MNKKYREAMDNLPFSDDLNARTIAMLNAASATSHKEDGNMKKNKKWISIGGSVLAAAACLTLVLFSLNGNVLTSKESDTQNLSTSPALGAIARVDMAPTSSAQDSADVSEECDSFYPADYEMFADTAPMTGLMQSPDFSTEEYAHISENRFLATLTTPFSTFAADADTASYAKLRSSILAGVTPPVDSVRIEEMLNYFSYNYAAPKDDEPFGVTTELADCPWNKDTKLLLVGLQAQTIQADTLPQQNLVFLVDVSGSMEAPDKLPLAKRAFMLLLEELKPEDTVSIVTYASGDRIVLDGEKAANKTAIMEALESMTAGGGTAGAQGIETAYQIAQKHFIKDGNNRVILATDGDLNIGISDEGSLTRLIEGKRDSGIFLSVLGFGSGNYKDNKLEALADHGNGNYAYIDTIHEARKALVEEIGATFFTVAKDVKLQVEFNPAKIKGYRLIGYENRTMAAEDFADDTKDGGEIGSGHRLTAVYEIVPVDSAMKIDTVESKYQTPTESSSSEWLTLAIRLKAPDGDTSSLYTYTVDESAFLPEPSDNMCFASAVCEVGMLLTDSQYKQDASYASALERLRSTASVTGDVYKEEFQYLVTLLGR